MINGCQVLSAEPFRMNLSRTSSVAPLEVLMHYMPQVEALTLAKKKVAARHDVGFVIGDTKADNFMFK